MGRTTYDNDNDAQFAISQLEQVGTQFSMMHGTPGRSKGADEVLSVAESAPMRQGHAQVRRYSRCHEATDIDRGIAGTLRLRRAEMKREQMK